MESYRVVGVKVAEAGRVAADINFLPHAHVRFHLLTQSRSVRSGRN